MLWEPRYPYLVRAVITDKASSIALLADSHGMILLMRRAAGGAAGLGWPRGSLFTLRSLSAGACGGDGELGNPNAMGQDRKELLDVWAGPAAVPLPPAAGEDGDGRYFQEPQRPQVQPALPRTREEIHASGDWHRSVQIWFVDREGRVLMQRRSALKDTHPNLWDVTVAGHIPSGCQSRETALKEVEEEVGFVLPSPSLLRWHFVTMAWADGHVAGKRFICREFQDVFSVAFHQVEEVIPSLQLEEGEVAEVGVFSLDEVERALRQRDPAFVGRQDHFIDRIFPTLRAVTR